MAFKTGIHGCLIDDKLVSFLQILGIKRKDWERARNLQRSGMGMIDAFIALAWLSNRLSKVNFIHNCVRKNYQINALHDFYFKIFKMRIMIQEIF